MSSMATGKFGGEGEGPYISYGPLLYRHLATIADVDHLGLLAHD